MSADGLLTDLSRAFTVCRCVIQLKAKLSGSLMTGYNFIQNGIDCATSPSGINPCGFKLETDHVVVKYRKL